MNAADAWTHATLPRLDKRVSRLGIAFNYGLDAAGARAALFDHGMQYVFWTPLRGKGTDVLREALAADRERYVVAAGPTLGYWGGSFRSFVDRSLRTLGTDYLDVLQLNWLGVSSAWTEGTVDALRELRASGKVRAIGVSIHDRPRAGQLAADDAVDSLMIRYNAAHPGAERDIFPHLRGQNVCAYTATRWRKLLKRPKGWEGRVPTAADCYRFCLSDPHVHVVLTGPKNLDELRENLSGLDQGAMEGEELEWMRSFGKVVHG
ncbi:MAG: aldo/keto reductase [Alphaproteobacteria bacterium]|nr:aldo/keto reductase [Alphaproteobacteria bacterium]